MYYFTAFYKNRPPVSTVIDDDAQLERFIRNHMARPVSSGYMVMTAS
jgi:hypothetical protein